MSIDITAKSLWFTQILHRPQRSAWNITLKLALIPIPSKMITCCQCCHSRFSNQHQSTSININITKLQEKNIVLRGPLQALHQHEALGHGSQVTLLQSQRGTRTRPKDGGNGRIVWGEMFGHEKLNWTWTNFKISPDGKATLDMRNVICKGKATENGGFGDL